MSQAKCQRIAASRLGEFVHEGLDRENVAMRSKRPERAVSHWRIEQEMVPDLLPRQLIRWHRVTVAIAKRLRNVRRRRFHEGSAQVPRREEIDAAGLPGPHRVAAADKAGWTLGTKGAGQRGRGLAFCRYKSIGMYAAAVVDVEVDRKTGLVKVPRVVMAADIGLVVNPDGAKNQLEGGIVQAVSLTLKEQVAFDRREITSRDWSGYPILAFSEVPSIEIMLMERSDPSLGAGEGALPPTSAALANAFAHATGRRLRDLPMTPDRVKALLS
jgi:CO/xanthine dehydrogenase Mo-binding subunit